MVCGNEAERVNMETTILTASEATRAISFSAMVRNRFSDQLLAEIKQYANLRNIDLQNATLSNVVVTSLERDVVYADVLFQCTTGEGSLITDRRIRTYCLNDQMIPLPRVVALCIGLKLHPILSLDLVKKAGYLFNQTPEHVAYQMILVAMTHNSIYECNEYLKTLGLKPIGKEE